VILNDTEDKDSLKVRKMDKKRALPKIGVKKYQDLLIGNCDNDLLIPKKKDIQSLLKKYGYQGHDKIVSELNNKLQSNGFLVKGKHSRYKIAKETA